MQRNKNAGGRTVGLSVAWDLLETFLGAAFSQAERHLRRLGKVASLERKEKGRKRWISHKLLNQ